MFALRFVVVAVFFGLAVSGLSAADRPVDYLKQIKPLFNKHCVQCHGAKKQQSGLRMDTAAAAIKGGDRGPVIVPGKGKESLIIEALEGRGENVEQMPADNPQLSAKQIALIRRWIDEGAKHPKNEKPGVAPATSLHWSFQPIRRPTLPRVKDRGWVRNPIDAFILARLETKGLKPSPPASRTTLIRRASFDLRGVPPTPAEIRRFTTDTRPGAYERMVDRMFASPQYGERWGRHWLDAARYADSNGFTIDGPRSIWKYRDWVIRAVNADLPFDRFTAEQLAGDLLPNATTDQIIATGFHRNTLINQEGGTDKEQFRVDAVADRVNTTGSVFLGLTVGCARCHAHKFDPISQRDYYQLFAIFNDCDEPTIRVPTPQQTAALKRLTAAVSAAEKPLQRHDRAFLKGLPAWEKQLKSRFTSDAGSAFAAVAPAKLSSERGTLLEALPDKSVFVDFSHPPNDTYVVELKPTQRRITAIRLEALTHKSLPKTGPGYAANGNFVLTEFEARVVAGKGQPRRIRFAKAVADHSQNGYPVTHAIDGKPKTGWAINLRKGSPNVDREAIFFPETPIEISDGATLIVKLRHDINRNYMIGHFRLSISDAPASLLSVPTSIRKIVMTPAKRRTKAQRAQLQAAYLATDGTRAKLVESLEALRKERDRLDKSVPTTMVLRRRKKPRQTHIHIRGDFLRKGAEVQPDVPAAFPPFPKTVKHANRLDFAHWLTDARNPLTARVTVNRYWQRFFGLGFVDTENDFGLQGSKPTHPMLLDWLASEFKATPFRRDPKGSAETRDPRAWSVKALHRLIVTSATYRQSSRMRPDLLKRDPRNRLLARQSRLRLEAETIRDAALAVSGLLSAKMLGPGVYPPQPKGIYVVTQQKKNWPENTGADRFRRGMYTYFWRSSPYPFLPTFDAPDANTACTRRSRSNTPLQALTLANDRAFVEMAGALALRILREGPRDDAGRVRHAFRTTLSRDPKPAEAKTILQFLKTQRAGFQSDATRAKQAAPASLPKDVAPTEAAAWTAVARVLLNLDEFITRE
ncbi:MAG: PSD1 and planctomycete cytochrome C domain-containing protein [Planctomycetaceae bacterium]